MPDMSELMKYICAYIPRYAGFTGTFDGLPIVTKREYIDDYNSFVSTLRGRDRAMLVDALRSKEIPRSTEDPFGDDLIIEHTSGSSGVPFKMVKTKAERLKIAGLMWERRRAIDPQVRTSNYTPLINAPINRRFTPVLPGSDVAADEIWNRLEAANTRWLHTSPPMLLAFAEALGSIGQASRGTIRFAEYTGQRLEPDDRKTIERVLALLTVNQYALREVWAVGTAIGDDTLEPLEDNVCIEIVSDDGSPVPMDQSGRIVVTNLNLRLMPFVRYDTGDRGVLSMCGGRLSLTLDPYREHMMFHGISPKKAGPPIFKKILKELYGVIQSGDIKTIQIRQWDLATFEVIMDPVPNVDKIVSAIEANFNGLRLYNHLVHFVYRPISDTLMNHPFQAPAKLGIFTTKRFEDDRAT